jgi:tetratricopeptide (TPR) repeat protein
MPFESLLPGGSEPEPDTSAAESGDRTQVEAAVAAALAMDIARNDPALAAEAAAYFRANAKLVAEQTRLLEAQIENLHDETPYEMSHLRGRSREGRLRRFGLVVRNAVQAVSALVFGVVALLLAAMAYQAFTTHSVVVEVFDAPDSLAPRGLTGKGIANAVLDQLTLLRNATIASSAGLTVTSAWANDIKVDVPSTGISLGEIDRLLRERFGNDLHISGSLVQRLDGSLALTVRGDHIPPRAFAGAPALLDHLVTEAAEYVYGQSQPAKFAIYLDETGRSAEAVDFAKAAYTRTAAAERPGLLNAWANAVADSGGDLHEAVTLYRTALRLKPDNWVSYGNIMSTQMVLGDEDGAWRTGQALLKAAGRRPGPAPETTYEIPDELSWDLTAQRLELLADSAANDGLGTFTGSPTIGIAIVDAFLHDAADSELQLKTAPVKAADPTIAAGAHFVRGVLALEGGDAAAAVRELEMFGAAMKDPRVAFNYLGSDCWIAPAEEAAGRPAQADAAMAAVGAGGHFVDCKRFHADILDHRGDWGAAQHAYAEAVALAPDLPSAYYSWGVALARHGDHAGAIEKLGEAHARGPHWADPLKAWGDVLAQTGDAAGARAKYDAAMQYAPAWAALRAARERLGQ